MRYKLSDWSWNIYSNAFKQAESSVWIDLLHRVGQGLKEPSAPGVVPMWKKACFPQQILTVVDESFLQIHFDEITNCSV